jgi:hypothetical protein
LPLPKKSSDEFQLLDKYFAANQLISNSDKNVLGVIVANLGTRLLQNAEFYQDEIREKIIFSSLFMALSEPWKIVKALETIEFSVVAAKIFTSQKFDDHIEMLNFVEKSSELTLENMKNLTFLELFGQGYSVEIEPMLIKIKISDKTLKKMNQKKTEKKLAEKQFSTEYHAFALNELENLFNWPSETTKKLKSDVPRKPDEMYQFLYQIPAMKRLSKTEIISVIEAFDDEIKIKELVLRLKIMKKILDDGKKHDWSVYSMMETETLIKYAISIGQNLLQIREWLLI